MYGGQLYIYVYTYIYTKQKYMTFNTWKIELHFAGLSQSNYQCNIFIADNTYKFCYQNAIPTRIATLNSTTIQIHE